MELWSKTLVPDLMDLRPKLQMQRSKMKKEDWTRYYNHIRWFDRSLNISAAGGVFASTVVIHFLVKAGHSPRWGTLLGVFFPVFLLPVAIFYPGTKRILADYNAKYGSPRSPPASQPKN